jgi:uracil-DNA glycosylase family 4
MPHAARFAWAAAGRRARQRPARGGTLPAVSDRERRRAELEAFHAAEVVGCVRCPLSEGRTQVVVGNGDPDADLMFVGEAPGYHEDRLGLPFVGQAGKVLDRLLSTIGLRRSDVFVANVLKCRPPGNRDPLPSEVEACEGYLFRQMGLIRPAVVCTLGNFATRLLSGRPDPISRVRGRERALQVGDLSLILYPLYHPAAALYTPAMMATLETDFARIPALIAAGAPEPAAPAVPEPEREPVAAGAGRRAEPEQLGLF